MSAAPVRLDERRTQPNEPASAPEIARDLALVEAPSVETPAAPLATVSDGTSVALHGGPGSEVLEVRDARGRLLFEHRAGERRSVVHVPAGSLELRVDEGDLDLVASGRVRVRGDLGVEVVSALGVSLQAPRETKAREGAPPVLDARVDVTPAGVRAQGPVLETRARRATLAADDAGVVVARLNTAIERATHAVGVLETRAGRIVERAKSTYRDVRDLAQLRAGRIRWVADATVHVFGQRAHIKAEVEVSLQGEKIYLG